MKTQRTACPHCHHQVTISDEQLALKNSLARCANCHQTFFTEDKLLAPIVIGQKPAVPSTPRSLNQKKSPQAYAEGMFDDNATLEGTPSLTVTPAADITNFDISEDFEQLTTPTRTSAKFEESHATSPTADLAIKGDEAWLEKLLIEERQKELNASHFDNKKISAMPASATDVESLLEEFGVEVVPEKQLTEQEYYQKVNKRLSHQPTSKKIAKRERRSLLPAILWSVGSALLLVGLIAQYIAYNRDELVKNPTQARTLQAICASISLPCNLAHADANAVAVQVHSLENKVDKTDIILTLTNQSKVVQLYPTLKLTLLANMTPVGQLIVLPQQYLDKANLHMSGEQVQPIKLRIDMPRNKFDKIAIDKLY